MKNAIISQYKAALKMLMDVIEKCPDNLWDNRTYENGYWRIVYHSLFYTSFYLSKSDDKFIPWVKHLVNYNCLGLLDHDDKPIIITDVYSKADLTNYATSILNSIEVNVNNLDIDDGSGFYWLPMTKLELQLYNIRHIQHHTGQLTERLHQVGIKGIGWKGKG
jgi:hypothetical protein